MRFLLIILLSGCVTYTPQKIRFCADYNLYTEKYKLEAAWHNYGGVSNSPDGFYSSKDNSIHAMKWDFNTIGHEVSHGMKNKGFPELIVEDRFDHFK